MRKASAKSTEREIFVAAARIQDAAEQELFLANECHGQPHLKDRLTRLLAARQRGECSPLNQAIHNLSTLPPPDPAATNPEPRDTAPVFSNRVDVDQPPVIDRYTLLEEIGRGGMGTVYMASQTEPVRRRVAVKVINPGMNSREVQGRFEAERQTLAVMNHPNIARVFDAGTTESGLPYFVMELVRGVSILQYCRQHQLPLIDRLELFVDVCHAIQHAHQKGIIHRDLKPSNVLVETHDTSAIPKVIDFGIAKAIGAAAADSANFTGFYEVLGTPMYMSPEQAEFNAVDVDTRSDVYSLGVLLYELVTDQPPFDPERIRKAGYSELFQIIREETPTRPSRLTTARGSWDSATLPNNSVSTTALARRVRGELDWIVMKALEKDRLRRYQSARQLAEDVRRFADHEPIAARPPSVLYLLQKTARRNRGIIVGGMSVVLALLLGTGAAIWQARQAGIARISAEYQAELTAQMNRQLAEQIQVAELARAETNEQLYATEVHLASQACLAGDIHRARTLLDRQTNADRVRLTKSFEWQYLQRCVEISPHWTKSYLGQIRCARISPNQRWIALACHDSVLRILDVNTGLTICEHLTWTRLNSAAWSPDGGQVACACSDGTVRLFSFRAREPDGADNSTPSVYELQLLRGIEAQTSPEEQDFIDDAGEANDALYTPDGKTLFTAGDDTLVRVWDRHTESQVTTLSGHSRAVERMALSPAGSYLATAGSDATLRLWDTRSNAQRGAAVTLPERIVSVAFSPDGTLLAAGGIGGEVVLVEVATGDISRKKLLDGIESLVFLSPSYRLVTGDRAGTVRIWQLTNHPGDRFPEHAEVSWLADQTRIQTLTADQQHRRVISGSRDGEVSSWSTTRARTYSQVDAAAVFAFHSNGDLLLGHHQLLRLTPGGRRIISRQPVSADGWELLAVCPNLPRAILASDKHVVVLDLEKETAVAQWDCTKHIYCVAISPDGQLAATVDYASDFVQLRSAVDGTVIQEYPVRGCRCLAFSPDGTSLAAGSHDDLLLYSLGSDSSPKVLSGHSSTLRCVSFHPDGSTIATGSNDRHIRIWDATSGGVRMNVPAHSGDVSSIRYSSDGTRLVSAGDTGRVRIWHASSMQPLLDLDVPGNVPAKHAELSPDHRRLVVRDRNGTVSIFETPETPALTRQHGTGSDVRVPDSVRIVDFDALGDLDGGIFRSLVSGISPDGSLVLGHSFHTNGFCPFVWSRKDGIRRLGPPYPQCANGSSICASADHSIFGGAGGLAKERGYSPRLWYPDGSTRRVTKGFGAVVGLSADGHVAAGHSDTSGRLQPFLYRDSQLQWLPLPSSKHHSIIAAMTPDGKTVAGTTYLVKSAPGATKARAKSDWRNAQPVLWKNGETQDLSGFDPQWNWKAVDVSDDGNTIIGSCWAPGEKIHHPGARMFVWRPGELELFEPPPGFLELRPQAASGDGKTIVGLFGQAVNGNTSHAFRWTSESGFVDLNSALRDTPAHLEWKLVDALEVSADGKILAGYGKNPDGNLEGWRLTLQD